MRRVLIVGVNGLMGRMLSARFRHDGWKVLGFGRGRDLAVCDAYWDTSFGFCSVPTSVLENLDGIVFCAWVGMSRGSRGEVSYSEGKSINLVDEFCNWLGVEIKSHVIFVSSGGAVYGRYQRPVAESDATSPVSIYGKEKLRAENLFSSWQIRSSGTFVSLRVSNPFGSLEPVRKGIGFVDIARASARDGVPLELFVSGDTVRDYVHWDDVYTAFLSALYNRSSATKKINIGSGKGISLSEVVDGIRGKYPNVLVNVITEKKADIPFNVLNISLARDFLDWEPKIDLMDWLHEGKK
jgi:UDP-glucose 4-epimerase